jgi:hypothetical protein
VSPLRLFGVTALEDEPLGSPVHGAFVVSFRDLDAVVAEVPFEQLDSTSADVEKHHDAISAVFSRFPIVPAPYGVVLGSTTVVQRWLEVHYFTLSDALRYVEDRVSARVYVSERSSLLDGMNLSEKSDVLVIAGDAFRTLRRLAVSSSTLRASYTAGGQRAAATFLVERDGWAIFSDAVAEAGRRYPTLFFRLTGPWPPYDFVRLQLGG